MAVSVRAAAFCETASDGCEGTDDSPTSRGTSPAARRCTTSDSATKRKSPSPFPVRSDARVSARSCQRAIRRWRRGSLRPSLHRSERWLPHAPALRAHRSGVRVGRVRGEWGAQCSSQSERVPAHCGGRRLCRQSLMETLPTSSVLMESHAIRPRARAPHGEKNGRASPARFPPHSARVGERCEPLQVLLEPASRSWWSLRRRTPNLASSMSLQASLLLAVVYALSFTTPAAAAVPPRPPPSPSPSPPLPPPSPPPSSPPPPFPPPFLRSAVSSRPAVFAFFLIITPALCCCAVLQTWRYRMEREKRRAARAAQLSGEGEKEELLGEMARS